MAQWDEQDETAQGAEGNGGIYQSTGIDDLDADRIRQEMDRYMEMAANFIRERPVSSLFSAVALGFVVGRIASRR